MSVWRDFFPIITDARSAQHCANLGAIAGLILAGTSTISSVISIVVHYELRTPPSHFAANPMYLIILALFQVVLIMFLSYRVYKARGFVSAAALVIMAFAQAILSILTGESKIFHNIIYAVVSLMAINGLRGAWFGRNFVASS